MQQFKGKTALLFFGLFITGGVLSGCNIHSSFGISANTLKKEDSKEFIVEKTKIDKLEKIQIDTRIADVKILESDDYYVEIDYTYWEDEPEYRVENGVLYFDDEESFPESYSINFNLHNTVTIYLPSQAPLAKITFDSSSGDISAAGFVAEELEANVSYGDFTLENASAKECDIRLSSGNSKIISVNSTNMEFTNSYGNAQFTDINKDTSSPFEASASDSIEISMSSGDIRLKGITTGNISISNSYGDVTCDVITAEELDVALSSGDFDLEHADIKEITVSNSYGNITLALIGSQEDYSIDVDTSYGKIKVDGESYDEHFLYDNGGTREIDADLSSGDITVKFQ
ncbi:MAG: hypothetical protein K0S76_884 [Herbinix sp.]|jgi:DUF4097 and DUF4098 domain-containing protein YvlB|nr:hypothetical protein [Herbinix sp.]